jgi:hypothetical protein
VSGKPIVLTLLALLVLTAISWAVSTVHLGAANMPVALAIAAVKATLASTPARVMALVTISFIALLCAGTVADLDLR